MPKEIICTHTHTHTYAHALLTCTMSGGQRRSIWDGGEGNGARCGSGEDKNDVRRSDPVRTRMERDEDGACEDENDALWHGLGTSKARRPRGPGARDALAG
jgi:hypothetical protein